MGKYTLSQSMRRRLKRALEGLDDWFEPYSMRLHEAQERGQKLCSELKRHGERKVWRAFAHGSQARGTALAGFDDVDYMVVFRRDELTNRYGQRYQPGWAINRLYEMLVQRRAGLVSQGLIEVRKQAHSVGVTYTGRHSDYRLDFVPAEKRGGRYEIPSRDQQTWIATDPTWLLEHITGLPDQVKGAIRLLKAWMKTFAANTGWTVLPGIAVEVWAHDWLQGRRRTVAEATVLWSLLTQLAEAHKRRRLGLVGESDAPVTILAPWDDTLNLASELTTDARNALIDYARETLEGIPAALDEGDDLDAWFIDEARLARVDRLSERYDA